MKVVFIIFSLINFSLQNKYLLNNVEFPIACIIQKYSDIGWLFLKNEIN